MRKFLAPPILLMAVVSLAFGQTPGVETTPKRNPFVGKWKANLSKSQRDPNHQFQSLALRFEISDDALLLDFYRRQYVWGRESWARKRCIQTAKNVPLPKPMA